MFSSTASRIAVLFLVAGFAAGCANTIRGVGADAANTVNATQQAGSTVANSVE